MFQRVEPYRIQIFVGLDGLNIEGLLQIRLCFLAARLLFETDHLFGSSRIASKCHDSTVYSRGWAKVIASSMFVNWTIRFRSMLAIS